MTEIKITAPKANLSRLKKHLKSDFDRRFFNFKRGDNYLIFDALITVNRLEKLLNRSNIIWYSIEEAPY